MSTFIHKIVSKNKNRYKDEKYDLDLSYITKRIIAMSFPGSGVRKIYRNSIDKVVQFLNEKHANSYKLFNLSMRTFEYNKFSGEVSEF